MRGARTNSLISADDLKRIHEKQLAAHRDTIRRLTKHLTALSRKRASGIVTSDDGVRWMREHNVGGDRRLLGALFVHGPFVKVGYAPASQRRGMHATWKIKPL